MSERSQRIREFLNATPHPLIPDRVTLYGICDEVEAYGATPDQVRALVAAARKELSYNPRDSAYFHPELVAALAPFQTQDPTMNDVKRLEVIVCDQHPCTDKWCPAICDCHDATCGEKEAR